MGNNPFGLGTGKEKSEEEGFIQSLFYFMKEFGFNPMVKENGVNIPMFNAMMKEMNAHYKREAEANKSAARRR